jgi:hypothetical protein
MLVSSVQRPTKLNCIPKVLKFSEREMDCEENNKGGRRKGKPVKGNR